MLRAIPFKIMATGNWEKLEGGRVPENWNQWGRGCPQN